MVFDPDKGHDLDDWMRYLNKTGEYVNNRYWTELTIKESHAIYRELLSWGLQFKPEDDSPEQYRSAPKGLSKPRLYTPAELSRVLRNQVVKSGARIFDRVMITELLKQDGRIIGATGMPAENNDLYTFIAKATILCVGACGYKPAGFPPLVQLTCDGEAMAYRAGAEIGGKEFVDTHYTTIEPVSTLGKALSTDPDAIRGREPGYPLYAELYNVEGNRINVRPAGMSEYRFTYLQLEMEAHEGRAPVFWRASRDHRLTGGAALGMSLRKADGLWPANTECASSVPGLYAAGDSLYTIQNGAAYALLGSSMAGSALTGSIAGTAAAKEALDSGVPIAEEEEPSAVQRKRYSPLRNVRAASARGG